MIICNHCGSPLGDGIHLCPECGSENPFVAAPEPAILSARAATMAALDFSEIKATGLNSQSLPPSASEAARPQSLELNAQPSDPSADACVHSPRPTRIVAVSVVTTVCLLALGFIIARTLLSSKREDERNIDSSRATPAQVVTTPSADMPVADQYTTYANSDFNYSIEYPANILSSIPGSENINGKRFTSQDGQSELTVSAIFNRPGETAEESYQTALADYSRQGKVVTYKVLRQNWYVISGFDGNRVFYERTIFNSGLIKQFKFEWPDSQRATYEQITNHISKTFTG
jgi:hypothetical protein